MIIDENLEQEIEEVTSVILLQVLDFWVKTTDCSEEQYQKELKNIKNFLSQVLGFSEFPEKEPSEPESFFIIDEFMFCETIQ